MEEDASQLPTVENATSPEGEMRLLPAGDGVDKRSGWRWATAEELGSMQFNAPVLDQRANLVNRKDMTLRDVLSSAAAQRIQNNNRAKNAGKDDTFAPVVFNTLSKEPVRDEVNQRDVFTFGIPNTRAENPQEDLTYYDVGVAINEKTGEHSIRVNNSSSRDGSYAMANYLIADFDYDSVTRSSTLTHLEGRTGVDRLYNSIAEIYSNPVKAASSEPPVPLRDRGDASSPRNVRATGGGVDNRPHDTMSPTQIQEDAAAVTIPSKPNKKRLVSDERKQILNRLNKGAPPGKGRFQIYGKSNLIVDDDKWGRRFDHVDDNGRMFGQRNKGGQKSRALGGKRRGTMRITRGVGGEQLYENATVQSESAAHVEGGAPTKISAFYESAFIGDGSAVHMIRDRHIAQRISRNIPDGHEVSFEKGDVFTASNAQHLSFAEGTNVVGEIGDHPDKDFLRKAMGNHAGLMVDDIIEHDNGWRTAIFNRYDHEKDSETKEHGVAKFLPIGMIPGLGNPLEAAVPEGTDYIIPQPKSPEGLYWKQLMYEPADVVRDYFNRAAREELGDDVDQSVIDRLLTPDGKGGFVLSTDPTASDIFAKAAALNIQENRLHETTVDGAVIDKPHLQSMLQEHNNRVKATADAIAVEGEYGTDFLDVAYTDDSLEHYTLSQEGLHLAQEQGLDTGFVNNVSFNEELRLYNASYNTMRVDYELGLNPLAVTTSQTVGLSPEGLDNLLHNDENLFARISDAAQEGIYDNAASDIIHAEMANRNHDLASNLDTFDVFDENFQSAYREVRETVLKDMMMGEETPFDIVQKEVLSRLAEQEEFANKNISANGLFFPKLKTVSRAIDPSDKTGVAFPNYAQKIGEMIHASSQQSDDPAQLSDGSGTKNYIEALDEASKELTAQADKPGTLRNAINLKVPAATSGAARGFPLPPNMSLGNETDLNESLNRDGRFSKEQKAEIRKKLSRSGAVVANVRNPQANSAHAFNKTAVRTVESVDRHQGLQGLVAPRNGVIASKEIAYIGGGDFDGDKYGAIYDDPDGKPHTEEELNRRSDVNPAEEKEGNLSRSRKSRDGHFDKTFPKPGQSAKDYVEGNSNVGFPISENREAMFGEIEAGEIMGQQFNMYVRDLMQSVKTQGDESFDTIYEQASLHAGLFYQKALDNSPSLDPSNLFFGELFSRSPKDSNPTQFEETIFSDPEKAGRQLLENALLLGSMHDGKNRDDKSAHAAAVLALPAGMVSDPKKVAELQEIISDGINNNDSKIDLDAALMLMGQSASEWAFGVDGQNDPNTRSTIGQWLSSIIAQSPADILQVGNYSANLSHGMRRTKAKRIYDIYANGHPVKEKDKTPLDVVMPYIAEGRIEQLTAGYSIPRKRYTEQKPREEGPLTLEDEIKSQERLVQRLRRQYSKAAKKGKSSEKQKAKSQGIAARKRLDKLKAMLPVNETSDQPAPPPQQEVFETDYGNQTPRSLEDEVKAQRETVEQLRKNYSNAPDEESKKAIKQKGLAARKRLDELTNMASQENPSTAETRTPESDNRNLLTLEQKAEKQKEYVENLRKAYVEEKNPRKKKEIAAKGLAARKRLDEVMKRLEATSDSNATSPTHQNELLSVKNSADDDDIVLNFEESNPPHDALQNEIDRLTTLAPTAHPDVIFGAAVATISSGIEPLNATTHDVPQYSLKEGLRFPELDPETGEFKGNFQSQFEEILKDERRLGKVAEAFGVKPEDVTEKMMRQFIGAHEVGHAIDHQESGNEFIRLLKEHDSADFESGKIDHQDRLLEQSADANAIEALQNAADVLRSPDNLTSINHVGKARNQKLHDAGIQTIRDLATASVEDVSAATGAGEKKAQEIIRGAQEQFLINELATEQNDERRQRLENRLSKLRNEDTGNSTESQTPQKPNVDGFAPPQQSSEPDIGSSSATGLPDFGDYEGDLSVNLPPADEIVLNPEGEMPSLAEMGDFIYDDMPDDLPPRVYDDVPDDISPRVHDDVSNSVLGSVYDGEPENIPERVYDDSMVPPEDNVQDEPILNAAQLKSTAVGASQRNASGSSGGAQNNASGSGNRSGGSGNNNSGGNGGADQNNNRGGFRRPRGFINLQQLTKAQRDIQTFKEMMSQLEENPTLLSDAGFARDLEKVLGGVGSFASVAGEAAEFELRNPGANGFGGGAVSNEARQLYQNEIDNINRLTERLVQRDENNGSMALNLSNTISNDDQQRIQQNLTLSDDEVSHVAGAVHALADFNDQISVLSEGLPALTKRHGEYVSQVSAAVSIYDNANKVLDQINTKAQAFGEDSLTNSEKQLRSMLQRELGEGGVLRNVGDSRESLVANSAKAKAGIRLNERERYTGEDRRADLFATLMRGGVSGRRDRRELSELLKPSLDDPNDRGGLFGRGIVTNEAVVRGLGVAGRTMAGMRGMMHAASSVGYELADPLFNIANDYRRMELMKEDALLQSGQISFSEALDGSYGKVRQESIMAYQLRQSAGAQLYNAYAPALNIVDSDVLGRNLGAAATIFAPGVAGAALGSAFGPMGGVAGGVAGTTIGATAYVNMARNNSDNLSSSFLNAANKDNPLMADANQNSAAFADKMIHAGQNGLIQSTPFLGAVGDFVSLSGFVASKASGLYSESVESQIANAQANGEEYIPTPEEAKAILFSAKPDLESHFSNLVATDSTRLGAAADVQTEFLLRQQAGLNPNRQNYQISLAGLESAPLLDLDLGEGVTSGNFTDVVRESANTQISGLQSKIDNNEFSGEELARAKEEIKTLEAIVSQSDAEMRENQIEVMTDVLMANGIPPEQAANIYQGVTQYAGNASIDEQMTTMLELAGLAFAGVTEVPQTAISMVASQGISLSSEDAVFGQMQDIAEYFRELEGTGVNATLEKQRLDNTAQRNMSINPLRSAAGLGLRSEYFYNYESPFANEAYSQDLTDQADMVRSEGRILSTQFDVSGDLFQQQVHNRLLRDDTFQANQIISRRQEGMQVYGALSEAMYASGIGETYSTVRQQVSGNMTQEQYAIASAMEGGDAYALSRNYERIGDIRYRRFDEQGRDTFLYDIDDVDQQLIDMYDQYGQFNLTGQEMAMGTRGVQDKMRVLGLENRDYQMQLSRDQMAASRFQQTGRYGAGGLELGEDGMVVSINRESIDRMSQMFRDMGLGEYQETMSGIELEDAFVNLQREQQDFEVGQREEQLSISDEQFALQEQQFLENFALNMAQFAYNTGFQQESLNINAERSRIQLGYQREDLAFGRQQSQVGFGFQMEDFDRNLRYARGRDRQDLLRQKERAVIQQSMQMSQMDVQEGRLDTQEGFMEQDIERAQENFEQLTEFQRESMEMSYDHFYEQRQLTDRQRELEREAHYESIRFMNEQRNLEDEQRLLQRQHSELMMAQQEQQLEIQQEFQIEMDRLSQSLEMIGIANDIRNQELADTLENANRNTKVWESFLNEVDRSGDVTQEFLGQISTGLNGIGTSSSNLLTQSANAIRNIFDTVSNSLGDAINDIERSIQYDSPVGPNPDGSTNGNLKSTQLPDTASTFFGPGFADGGYTGAGSKYEVKGVVHADEYVIPSEGAPILRDGATTELLREVVSLLKEISQKEPSNINVTTVDPAGQRRSTTIKPIDRAYTK